MSIDDEDRDIHCLIFDYRHGDQHWQWHDEQNDLILLLIYREQEDF